MLLQLYFLKWWINSYPCLTKPWGKSFGNPWSIDYVHTNFLFKNLNLFIKYCSRTSKQILKMEDSVWRCKVRIVYINSPLDSRIMMIVPCFTWSQWLQLWTLSLIWQKQLFFWDSGSSLFTFHFCFSGFQTFPETEPQGATLFRGEGILGFCYE